MEKISQYTWQNQLTENEAVQGKQAEPHFLTLNVLKVYWSTVLSILEKYSLMDSLL